ncbi:LysE family transporter [Nitriliruptor alkaliphilus]|uniref:LysE family transporter n=1 Tax=Nitriliruptor alkaliphilus TaxID=427918 RepID=UPI0006989417|nr:LysE family transporter [Nitriliruptor alkaliphilus]
MTSLSIVLGAAVAGLAAGLALAVPLGPIGLLLVDVSSRRGRHHGIAAALGIATVDLGYATLAVGSGAAVTALLAPVDEVLRSTAAILLVGLGVLGVRAAWNERRGAVTPPPPPRGSAARTGLAFAALTAVNPGTLLHGGIIAVALSDRLPSLQARAAFVLSLAVASLSWQLGLVGVGTVLGRLPRPAARRWLRAAGGAAVITLGAAIGLTG